MGYKLLGMAVWKGGKWCVRPRVDTRRVLIVSAVAVAVAGGVAFILRSDGEE